MIRTKGRNYRESVCLYKSNKTVGDFGKEVEGEPTLVCQTLANVSAITGTRVLKFNEIGIEHPVIVNLRNPKRCFDFIEWNNKRIVVTSTDDKENRGEDLTIYGNLQ